MFWQALFDPFSIVVLAAVLAMTALSLGWLAGAARHRDVLAGGLVVLRKIGAQLAENHPIRRRLESAPVVDLSFEELARLLSGQQVEPAARALIRLGERISWIERFAQLAVHLGILGTVFALVSSDPTDLEGFRASLPMALGTTFWGLIGAIALSLVAGACETLLERASQHVREALLEGLEHPPARPEP
ncbi:MotA/TolQ/ExbB proton channel family protein [Nannocystis bainbridge]|uniref:MotA/TolQ/ExbB proton channel family protein n=1 Tax=Nannocystis bainbridge TaxID=2995303 RepID=A0ABT5DQE6_9BACT|nr:MotA/TolQ/ExbB proton channel family protein [Nannocystis bainbridge]MDC0715887.1 MotA/TolQ/ExbB proton channel family protein [Nannocystis bainbridge]